MEYGIQLYSVRDVTPTAMEDTLHRLAAMGYRTVEFAGYFDHTPTTLRRWLADCGLKAVATHTGWDALRDRFDEVVREHKELNCPAVVIPGYAPGSPAELDAFVAFLNDRQTKLEKEGLRLGYHNHSFEFEPNAWGCRIHEVLQEQTAVELEIDTYWAWNAGVEPVALLKKLGDRVRLIHIKDGLAGGEGRPLGRGEAPVEAVWRYAREAGLHMIVESETLDPDGLTEARLCREHLAKLEG
ncbi:MAG: TIM barrel protein [Clostridia bacterium]|nr:TIM barrel protein [Clostridia bacterium]